MIGDKSGFYSSTMRRPSPTHSGHPSVQMIMEVFEHLGDGPITTISRLARESRRFNAGFWPPDQFLCTSLLFTGSYRAISDVLFPPGSAVRSCGVSASHRWV